MFDEEYLAYGFPTHISALGTQTNLSGGCTFRAGATPMCPLAFLDRDSIDELGGLVLYQRGLMGFSWGLTVGT